MKTIDLAFQRLGEDGPALLILHGLFGCGRNWNSLARKLAENFRVILPDLRNHGASGHSTEMDYPHLAADLVRLLDREGIDSATVIGHSMGGKVAVWLALTEPARIARLAAVDIAPVRYEHDFDSIIFAMAGLRLDEIQNRADADERLSQSIPEPGLRRFLMQNLVFDQGRYRWRIDLGLIQQAMHRLLDFPFPECRPGYPGKALFIGGACSRYLLNDHLESIHRFCPSARLEFVPDAGHWVHVDQAERFFDILNRFLT